MEADVGENSSRPFGELEMREKAAVFAKLSGLAVKGAIQDWLYIGIDMFSPSERCNRHEHLHDRAIGILAVHNVEPAFARHFV